MIDHDESQAEVMPAATVEPQSVRHLTRDEEQRAQWAFQIGLGMAMSQGKRDKDDEEKPDLRNEPGPAQC